MCGAHELALDTVDRHQVDVLSMTLDQLCVGWLQRLTAGNGIPKVMLWDTRYLDEHSGITRDTVADTVDDFCTVRVAIESGVVDIEPSFVFAAACHGEHRDAADRRARG